MASTSNSRWFAVQGSRHPYHRVLAPATGPSAWSPGREWVSPPDPPQSPEGSERQRSQERGTNTGSLTAGIRAAKENSSEEVRGAKAEMRALHGNKEGRWNTL